MLASWEPFDIICDLDRLAASTWRRRAWAPRVDVVDREDSLLIRAEVPGVASEDLEITTERGALSISGTRSESLRRESDAFRVREIVGGDFRRSITLPEGLDLDSITATCNDGVDEIAIGKSAEVLPRKVEITVG